MTNKLLFKDLKICDPNSSFHNKRVDVFVEDGIIKEIGKDLNKRAEEIAFKGAVVMPGFCDLYADFSDPGFEHREDIESGAETALRGGFTAVCTTPNTHPVVQSKSSVEYVINKSKGKGIDVYPLGAVSEDLKGSDPTEIYDMEKAGAKGFTDAPHAINDSGLLLRALQYVQPFNGIIFDMSTDESLSNSGHVNEGQHSVRMGIKGVPHIAEIIQIKRNIEILRYTGGRLHIYGITTKEGVALIKEAKKEGLDITASVFVHHLLMTDELATSFDSNYKIQPPFRSKKDREALKKGLLDGVIDCIATQHTPIEIEGKKLEFEYATPGLIGLQTAYATVLAAFEGQEVHEDMVKWLSQQPRKILGVATPSIEAKQLANFTIVNPKEEWLYDGNRNTSKSLNSPLLGKTLKGKVLATFHQGKLTQND
ncbi:MAG: dihydroorotase [Chitinophagales bacterium]